jgi:hypothetical protein
MAGELPLLYTTEVTEKLGVHFTSAYPTGSPAKA